MKGYVQVYTGNGKGKTTAALGQALRAAGAGLRVYIAQFLKGMHYSELHSIQRYSDLITLKQYGGACFINGKPSEEDYRLSGLGLRESREAILSGKYEMVILDEANVAVHFGLLKVEDLLDLIAIKPEGLELVITGRYAPTELLEKADLVTEMKEIKHYYTAGVQARNGIEK
ncbi:MAG: cob(I)yrinic acid a,c-diamide adenosyltransferase [Deltaproteobacteria bacterium]|nr:cob(I)yrinic acid a,c-diamide adenosyltransferase [Deltaproteobacteria bacterium]